MDWMHAAAQRGRGEPWVRWILVLGGSLGVAAGIIVFAEPAIGLVTLAVITGIFLVLDGITATAASLFEHVEGRYLGVLAAVISVLIGVILIRHPIPGVLAVGFLLGLWLIAAGVVRLASMVAEGHVRGWWLLVAVIEVAAGVVIVSSPRIAVSTLALLVGISFIVRGVAMAAVGWLMVASSDESGAPASGGPVAAT
jgi:membrane protein HdeD